MSLLLDALKRSEKARQEREAREGVRVEGPEETREFSLEALEEGARELREREASGEHAAQRSGEHPAQRSGEHPVQRTGEYSVQRTGEQQAQRTGEQPSPRSERARVAETVERSAVHAPPPAGGQASDEQRRRLVEDTAEGFPDLEIIEPEPDDTAHHSLEMQPDPARADTGSVERPAFSLLDDGPPPEAMADTHTSGGLPDAEQARASVDRYFDGTRSMSVSMRDVRQAVGGEEAEGREAAAGAAAPGARTSTTQRHARTVVEARAAASRARGRSGAWLWVAVLVVVGLFAGGGVWYYMNFLDTGPALFAGGVPPAPPPRAAAPQPAPAPAAPEVSTAAAGATAPGTSPAVAPEPAVTMPTVTTAALPEPPVRGELAPGAEPLAEAPPPAIEMPAPPVEEVLTTPQPAPAPPDSLEPVTPEGISGRLARAIRDAGLQGSGAGGGITITRTPRRDTVSPALADGFDAFQRGDDAAARRAYESVLARQPGNRDALLGLAAVSMRAGETQRAGELYLRVLRDHPRDRVAQASVIALSDRLDPVEAESRIKGLREAAPESPYPHFLLGNVYAAQQRWSLAQEAYFQAFRLDSANPDYAFNLAVSLDHLSQGRAALGYYQRALELADSRPAGFQPSAALTRIRAMSAGAGGQ